jgi:subtilisin family serine protease
VHAICTKTASQYAIDAKRLGMPADCHMPLQCQHVYSGACLSGGGFAGTFSPVELDLLIKSCLPVDSILYQEDDATVFKAEHQPEKKRTFNKRLHRRSLRQAQPGSNFEQNSAINGDKLNLTSMFQGQDINILKEKHQPLAAHLWNLDRIDQQYLPLDKTYSFGSAESPGVGHGVNIYVLDTGIMSNHQEFQTWSSFGVNNETAAAVVLAASPTSEATGIPSTSRASCGHDFVYGSANCEDIDGHGSHVAGTAIGLQIGVAKGASVIAVKILDDQGLGTVGSTIAGLDYVASTHRKPAVVTLSLGGQRGQYSRAMEDAVRALVQDHGVMVIAAAGNDASDSCQFSPGATPHAFTVAASSFAGKYSSFVSNKNNEDNNAHVIKAVEHEGMEGVYSEGNQGKCVNLFAPGTDIYSICGGIRRCGHVSTTTYAYASGTSMAVPHVAGAAAIFLESHPEASPAEVVEALKLAAVDGAISPMLLRADTANKLLQVRGLGGNQGGSAAAVQTADGPTASSILGKK